MSNPGGSAAGTAPAKVANRWFILAMGALLHACLGTVYAWSFFQKPLMAYAGWSNQQAAWVFSFAILFLGIFGSVGGNLLAKYGPLKLSVLGAVCYAIGWIIGGVALSMKSLPLMYLGMGLVGGCGLGMGYVCPVATAAKWFPDRKGLSTAIVLTGFGMGALLSSKLVAPAAVKAFTVDGVTTWPSVFFMIAACLGVPALFAALWMKNPPAGYCPAGYVPPAAEAASATSTITVKECVFSKPFAMIWFAFFINCTAGLLIIAFQSPLLQDLLKAEGSTLDAAGLAAAGATLIGFSSLCNGGGRPFWGWLSDKIGRVQTWRIFQSTQILVFIALIFVKSPIVFGVLVCYILLCTGAGFAICPSTVATKFGAKVMGPVYGTALTAWSLSGIVGPQLLAYIKDTFKDEPARVSPITFTIVAILLAISFSVTLIMTNKPYEQK